MSAKRNNTVIVSLLHPGGFMEKIVVLTAPKTINIGEYATEVPGPGEVLIRTTFSGISAGTLMTLYRGNTPFARKAFDASTRLFGPVDGETALYPIPGCDSYEETGIVEAIGDGVSRVAVGNRIYGDWGHRTTHLMTEADAADAILPEGIDPIAGIFAQIGSIALNGVLDADIHIGETVAIFGQGVPGQIAVQLAHASGARVIAVDLDDTRLAVSKRSGADVILNPLRDDVAGTIRGLTENRGADVVIEFSGSAKGLHEAIRSAVYNGRVICSGFIPGDGRDLNLGEEFHHNRIQLVCSQIRRLAPTLQNRWTKHRLERTILALQASGAIDLVSLVTHRFPIMNAQEAYALLDSGAPGCLQVVLVADGKA